MIHSGKCPHCRKTMTYVGAEAVEIKVGPIFSSQEVYKGVSYFCPSCKAVVGAAIDPIALKVSTAAETVNRLRKG